MRKMIGCTALLFATCNLVLANEVQAREPPAATSRVDNLSSATQEEFNRGLAEYNARRFAFAAEAFRRVLERDPQHAQGRAYLVQSYLEMLHQSEQVGDHERARECYRNALDLEPRLADDPRFRAGYRQAASSPVATYRKDEYEVEHIHPREGRTFVLSLAN